MLCPHNVMSHDVCEISGGGCLLTAEGIVTASG